MATRWRMPPDSSNGRLVGEAVEVHGAQQRLGPLPALLAADAAQAQRQLDVASAP